MRRAVHPRRQSVLLTAVAAIILLAACASTFAQAEKERPKGSLAEEIVGAWKGQTANDDEGDILTFTFKKDNSVTVSQGKHVDDATYSIIDAETVEIKAPNRPTLKFKIKIEGDAMHMSNAHGGTLELKRVK